MERGAIPAAAGSVSSVPMTVPERYLGALRASPVLADLDREELDLIYDLGSVQTFPAGTALVGAGELGMEAYVVLTGEVLVTLPDGSVDVSRPGEMVGEMALLGEGTNRRNATATTASEVAALVINRHYFETLLRDSPVLAERVRDRIRERAESRG